MNEIQKIFSNYLFRVMATWFGFYIQDKVAASILEPLAQAQQIADSFTIRNVGTQDNVEGIVNAFARQPGTGETEHERLVTQQWPGDEAATQHTVYDSIMYIGGEEVTV
jgi:hypothetical protein